MSSQNSGSYIEIQNIWKIFGNTSQQALDVITKKNISKQEALEKYNSVIGVSDVSFSRKREVELKYWNIRYSYIFTL